ncbi:MULTISPECIES: TetR/AcrR family transcriptional regulator [Sphingopyxis]|jgi:AcrR family transcriptional regulator|uniref:Transcriptional regulator, TetR family n=1 Tax=Sphingopyxis granuli TaxID=267128 RepID=A0AA86L464_9SPHN|nr:MULTISPECIES: TetR/AcrR family transcriptional regulator [Sphingopyxis]AMG75621.1 Transcriptional regulator, TetR family [Sphingopyxis granuli]HEV7312534.1 TetR/AcrR family transcriptional regulator [Sphingopyxis sp.]
MGTAPAISPSTPRSSILDIAVRLFGSQGYTGTSMRDIAKAFGVLPGSLYAHIDSKETLLVEIVETGINHFLEAVEPIAAAEGSAGMRLRDAIRAHIIVVTENPERSLVVFHQWRFLGDDYREAAIAKRQRYERAFIRILEDGIAEGVFDQSLNVRIAVLTILGALNWTPEWYSPKGTASPAEIGDMMANMLLRSLMFKG